jgi:hypothetical protein
MNTDINKKSVLAVSIVVLLISVALALPLLERIYTAAWQMYMFYGYAVADSSATFNGLITLSLKTGFIYSAFLAINYIIAFSCHRKANSSSLSNAAKFSKIAIYITLSTGIIYWLLGISNLNVWRP